MDLFAFNPLVFLLCFHGCFTTSDILPPGPVDAVLGKNVTFTPVVEIKDYAFVIWNFNDGSEQTHVATISSSGLIVNKPYEGRATLDTLGLLTLGPLKSDDSGDYSISVVLPSGKTDTAEIKLRVLEPVSDVAIKSDLPEAIEHNSTVVLSCTAKGSYLKFTWTNGTAPIVADSKRITIKDAELSSTLTITGVLRSDLVGPIVCTAANKLETEKSAPFNLTVYYGPDEVTITPSNPPAFIQSGSDLNLTCSAVSSPPATIEWYHNEKAMEVKGPVLTMKQIESSGLGKQVGQYKCVAKNAKSARAVSSPTVSFVVMDAVSGVKIMGPTATLIAGNSTANLSCQATAGTVTKREWLKNGVFLAAGSRVVFSKDMSSVLITMLQKEDNGEYTCVLGNEVNMEKVSYKMVVNYGPESAMITGDKAVEVTDAVTLTCSADSIPASNYTWKFNGSLTDVKTAEYRIVSAVYKNTGTYTCEANNAVTGKTASITHTLSVKEEGALDEGLSDGAIAGIVIAVLVALGAAIALIIYCRQKVPVESPY